ncbi:MAG: D-alanyl-D-alanine carboxypeptidase family protein [Ruminococcaceae bacterium]|nr:D-alanyl-D-alanine carboxypeptidase family protein [Oscillospiraceae bacterium]
MKKTLKALILLTVILSLFLQGCKKDDSDGSAGKDHPTVSNQVQNYHSSMEYAYTTAVDESILKTGLSADYLILANKENALGESYAPAELVTLTCPTNYGKTVELNRRAAEALYLMLAEMNASGVTDISVTSGYRSYQKQTALFNQYLSEESALITENAIACFGMDYIQKNYISKGLTVLSAKDAREVVLSYSALPGTSEHQTGLCVDFITSTMSDLDITFATTPAFAWLSNNAYRFGFILRYPEGKENITGYTYEPWHYRFVGREAATDIHFGKITLEEYLAD